MSGEAAEQGSTAEQAGGAEAPAGAASRPAGQRPEPGAGAKRRRTAQAAASPLWKLLLLALCSGLLTFFGTAFVTGFLMHRPPNARGGRAAGAFPVSVQSRPPEARHPTSERGNVWVSVPAPVSAADLRLTVLQFGEPAPFSAREKLERVEVDRVQGAALPPGFYVVRFAYLGIALPDEVAEVRPGQRLLLRPREEELAKIEYRSAIEGATYRDADIPHFRRVLELDPNHGAAHLQLAAYELLHGSPAAVEKHLAAVRRSHPKDPEAERVEHLLWRLQGRS